MPDEHGPYWYGYGFLGGRWRARYHGRLRPDPTTMTTREQAAELLTEFTSRDALSDDQLDSMVALAMDMVTLGDPESDAHAQSAQALIARERQRRDDLVLERHRQLLAKSLAGQELTPEEVAALQHASDLLAGEH